MSENDCYLCDISEKAVIKARNKGIKAYVCDVDNEKLPFHDGIFDIVTCFEVLEHVINTDFVLSEINRVLKQNGIFIVSTPNVNSIYSLFAQIFMDYPPIASARYKSIHVRDFTLKTLKIALHINGFEVSKTL